MKVIILHPKEYTKPIQWDARTAEGKMLVAGTSKPILDVCLSLLLERKLDPQTVLALRHADSEQHSFPPNSLIQLAEQSVSNEVKRLQALQKRSESGVFGGSGRFKRVKARKVPEITSASVAPLSDALRTIQGMKGELQ